MAIVLWDWAKDQIPDYQSKVEYAYTELSKYNSFVSERSRDWAANHAVVFMHNQKKDIRQYYLREEYHGGANGDFTPRCVLFWTHQARRAAQDN